VITRRALDISITMVADPGLCGERGVAPVVGDAVDGGVRTVRLHNRGANAAELLRQLEALATVVDGRAALLVDERVDVAIAARVRGIPVGGVHLEHGVSAASDARELLGDDAIIGLDVHTAAHLAELRRMPRRDVDYLGVGVIRPMATGDQPAALGVRGFARFAAEAELPCVAIGDITLADVRPLRDSGAAGIALESALCTAPDPRAAAAEFAAEWNAR
jgi:thiamine-phosphate pyrophosphorylase